MLLFLINYVIAIVFDSIDYKSKKYQMLENYDYLQFYMNKYHEQGFEDRIRFFGLYFYLVKVE